MVYNSTPRLLLLLLLYSRHPVTGQFPPDICPPRLRWGLKLQGYCLGLQLGLLGLWSGTGVRVNVWGYGWIIKDKVSVSISVS